jgi:hypothetical protein
MIFDRAQTVYESHFNGKVIIATSLMNFADILYALHYRERKLYIQRSRFSNIICIFRRFGI